MLDFVSPHKFLTTASSPASEPMAYYGLLGDYFGGFIGTLFAIVTSIATVYLLIKTLKQNSKTEYKSQLFSLLSEMLRSHDAISSRIVAGGMEGQAAFGKILREFSYIYKVTTKYAKDLSVNERIDIAYTFLFYGTTINAGWELRKHETIAKLINDHLSATRDKLRRTGKTEKLYSGHQNQLSHYYRNLFSIYDFINEADVNDAEKKVLGRVVRSKLSVHEQALLAINVISHFGSSWEKRGFIGKYQIIKHIPEKYFTLDNEHTIKNLFPYVAFEWEDSVALVKMYRLKILNYIAYIHKFDPAN